MDNPQRKRTVEYTLALQASGEYIMNNIAGVMEEVQDIWIRNGNAALDEEVLVLVEAEVKAIAEEFALQADKPLLCTHTRTGKWFATRKGVAI